MSDYFFVRHIADYAQRRFKVERGVCSEIKKLEEMILAENIPGAKVLIRRMRALDRALYQLSRDLGRFTPHKHHQKYTANHNMRRYVLLKSTFNILVADEISSEIRSRMRDFNLTPEAIKRIPISEGFRAAQLWRQKYLREKARDASQERVFQKHLSARVTNIRTALGEHLTKGRTH